MDGRSPEVVAAHGVEEARRRRLGAVVDGQANLDSAFRLTYRNRNLLGPRIQDAVTPDPSVRTGLSAYGLDQLTEVEIGKVATGGAATSPCS